jgi:hypothetical protein
MNAPPDQSESAERLREAMDKAARDLTTLARRFNLPDDVLVAVVSVSAGPRAAIIASDLALPPGKLASDEDQP